jgi:hypothetical protein
LKILHYALIALHVHDKNEKEGLQWPLFVI